MDFGLVDNEILEKYKCEMNGVERTYTLSLSHHAFSLKYSHPIFFQVGEFISKKNMWKDAIVDFIIFLSCRVNLYKFQPSWCHSHVFSSQPVKDSGDVCIKPNLYFNFVYASNDLYCLIKDLISYAGFESSDCVIRFKFLPKGEPSEIRSALITGMKTCFTTYLESNEMSEEDINKIKGYIKSINNHIEPLINSTYNNLYLIDDKNVLKTIIDKLTEAIKTKTKSSKVSIEKMEYSLSLYYDFFVFLCSIIKTKWFTRFFV